MTVCCGRRCVVQASPIAFRWRSRRGMFVKVSGLAWSVYTGCFAYLIDHVHKHVCSCLEVNESMFIQVRICEAGDVQ